jgi:hypothetical protein
MFDLPIQNKSLLYVDCDGDGKTDIAVFRPSSGMWHVLLSGLPDSCIGTLWGIATEIC